MKLHLILAVALSAALPLCAIEWSPVSSGAWEKSENGEMTFNGSRFARLSATLPLEKGVFYKFCWEARSAKPDGGKCVFLIIRDKRLALGHPLTANGEWQKNSVWFYSKTSGDARVYFDVPEKKDANWELRGFSIRRYTPQEVEKLVWRDNFGSGSLPVNFYLKKETPGNSLKIIKDDSFLSGTQSLVFEVGASTPRPDGIRSHYLPLLPGKNYLLTFWGKSGRDLIMQPGISLWAPSGHQGKHFTSLKKFAFIPEWKKYTMEFTVPENASEYPDIQECMGMLIFMTNDPEASGPIYLNEISLKVMP